MTCHSGRKPKRLCEEFEDQLRRGLSPQIEDYLKCVAGNRRESLLDELLAIELHWRQWRDHDVLLEDYRRRFPEFTSVIEKQCGQVNATSSTENLPTLLHTDTSVAADAADGDGKRASDCSFRQLRSVRRDRPRWHGGRVPGSAGQGGSNCCAQGDPERTTRFVATRDEDRDGRSLSA